MLDVAGSPGEKRYFVLNGEAGVYSASQHPLSTHDACHPREAPCSHPSRVACTPGDYVDRGAWGVETLALFLCLKLALPGQVAMLRCADRVLGCV